MLNSPIRISDRAIVTTEMVEAGLSRMTGKFTNMQIAGAFIRAGFVSDNSWDSQEAANRLLQKARKSGLIRYDRHTLSWERTYITQGMVDLCNNTLVQFCAVRMPTDAMKAMIETDPKFTKELIVTYPEAPAGTDDTLDTYDREGLFDIFATKLLGVSHWPCNSDSQETSDTFMAAMKRVVQDKLVEIVD
jgi:hypothetical protein